MRTTLRRTLAASATTATTVLGLTMLTATPAHAATDARITTITHAGSGCESTTTTTDIDPTGTKATLTFNNYTAQVGPGIPITNSARNCRVILGVLMPTLRNLTATATHSTYCKLEQGVQGWSRSSVRAGVDVVPTTVSETFTGPREDQCDVSASSTSALPLLGPTNVQLYSELRVDNPANRKHSGIMITEVMVVQLS
ncbi:DUF4360 domain-containing protein [Nocardia brasiliensis]|uniref:DUF4360 domain-containing protein n=1 Tax=Nocardia brasiliensis TaxID=37326 RepID=UPI0024567B7B|nr:DUF4360 domain-containing protein [Nocardia brasiliensis]